jgi:hypothetical protein
LESLACLGSFYILDGYIQELEKVLGKSRACLRLRRVGIHRPTI